MACNHSSFFYLNKKEGMAECNHCGMTLLVTPKPKRIQRKRTKYWKMPKGAVYVGRPSFWGNPYAVGKVWKREGALTTYVTEPSHAVQLFREYLKGLLAAQSPGLINSLRGKDLACWCPLDQPCHADVLLEVANA